MDWVATMGMHAALAGEGEGLLVAARVVLANGGEALILVTDENGGPVVAAGMRSSSAAGRFKQGLEPGVLEHHADGPGKSRIGPGGHVEGDDLAGLDELLEGRKALEEAGGGGRRRARWGRREGGRNGCRRPRRWRAEHAGHVRQVEHGEEDAHTLHDGGPELGIELEPVVVVPALDGRDALGVLARRAVTRLDGGLDPDGLREPSSSSS